MQWIPGQGCGRHVPVLSLDGRAQARVAEHMDLFPRFPPPFVEGNLWLVCVSFKPIEFGVI